jgi:hypothetical protein
MISLKYQYRSSSFLSIIIYSYISTLILSNILTLDFCCKCFNYTYVKSYIMYDKNIYCTFIKKDICGIFCFMCFFQLFIFYRGKISHVYYPNF